MSASTIAPVVKELVVDAPVERAWSTFTAGMGTWWPLDSHSIDGRRAEDVVFEERVGGRVAEKWADGTERQWGEVRVWEPPHRFVLAWQPNADRPDATEVEVTFTREGDGTRLRLEHRGWERLGSEGLESRNDYDSGWELVLGRYAAAR